MLYLTTGANGAGKTLNTLELVRKKQVEEGRAVYYTGFDMKPEKAAEFGWLPFDPVKWQELPDGAILIWDECQKGLPVRGSGAAVPPYVAALAEHRKRGFDFFLVSQHPLNIDRFVTRMIDSPGWHRHLKRTFGTDMVSVLEWSVVQSNPEKGGKSAKVTMVPYPKHVYQWYDSASLHTGKKSIPGKVYLFGALLLVIPLLFYFGVKQVTDKGKGKESAKTSAVSSAPVQVAAEKVSYVDSYVPRIPGLPHTAPRYDDLTRPTEAPRPAACVSMGARCGCYTQQGTAMDVPRDLCLQIVKRGFFQEWGTQGGQDKLQGGNPGAGLNGEGAGVAVASGRPG